MSLPAETPFATLGHPHELNPGLVGHVFGYNRVCPVGGAVANDNPFQRLSRLRNNGLYCQFDELGFIPSRRNENVLKFLWHDRIGNPSRGC
jgi:hypothetical protein